MIDEAVLWTSFRRVCQLKLSFRPDAPSTLPL
jgi:hypothetical protein